MGPPTGLFDVGGQRLVTPPIRGRADELKMIGALVTAVGHGRSRRRRHLKSRPRSVCDSRCIPSTLTSSGWRRTGGRCS
jgi:hypothetical protein